MLKPQSASSLLPRKTNNSASCFGARCVNVLFREPDHTAVLTASSFSRLAAPSKGDLFISQGDLVNAFYMLRCFPGLSDCVVMPPIKARALDIREFHGKPIDPNSLLSPVHRCLLWAGRGRFIIFTSKFWSTSAVCLALKKLLHYTTGEPRFLLSHAHCSTPCLWTKDVFLELSFDELTGA